MEVPIARDEPGGKRWVLPRRERAGLLAAVLLLFGIVFGGVGSFLYVMARRSNSEGASVALIFPIVGALLLLGALCVTLCWVLGRTHLRLSRDALLVQWRLGPLRWTRRIPRSGIADVAASQDASVGTCGYLTVTGPAGRYRLAAGRPYDVVKTLARELAESIGHEGRHGTAPPSPRLRMERLAGGIRIHLLPPGLRYSTGGTFGFAVVWCVGWVLLSAAIVMWLPQLRIWLAGAPLMLAFGAVLLLMGWMPARRHGTVEVIDGRLRIRMKDLFGERAGDWEAHQVRTVACQPSGSSTNDVAHMHLMVMSAGGHRGFFAAREPAELRWVAAAITSALAEARKDG